MEITCIGFTGIERTKQDIQSMNEFRKIVKNYLKIKMLKAEMDRFSKRS